jgi:transmembrane anterior posterior transformation protein 1
MVFIAEIIVDWLKHAFITRFNEIPSSVYREYTLSLAYDLAQTKQKNVNLLL